jgi:hypothetical protein
VCVCDRFHDSEKVSSDHRVGDCMGPSRGSSNEKCRNALTEVRNTGRSVRKPSLFSHNRRSRERVVAVKL